MKISSKDNWFKLTLNNGNPNLPRGGVNQSNLLLQIIIHHSRFKILQYNRFYYKTCHPVFIFIFV